MARTIICSLAISAMLSFCYTPTLASEIGVSVVFTDGEASTIRAYYRDNGAPHGNRNKKAKGLPPGIAKNLQRGKLLPPGIARQALPVALIDRLPPAPVGYERITVSGKVLLVEVATQVIHDVLEDVIIGK